MFKVFVINLDRSPERWLHVAKQLDDLQVSYERISAVDGRNLQEADIEKVFDSKQARKKYHYDLTKGEIACYLSHQLAWQRVVVQNLDFAVVLEDDVNIGSHLRVVLEHINQLRLPWSLLKLAAPFKAQQYRALSSWKATKLVQYRRKPPMGAAGYAISRAGAAQLLKQRKRIFRPVDVDMQWLFELNIQCFGIVPYVVDNTHQHGSDILSVEARQHVQRRPLVRLQHQLALFYDNLRARSRDKHLVANTRNILSS